MKRSGYLVLLLCLSIFSSCFKDYEERYLFAENRLEFQDAVVNPNLSGKNYPRLPGLSFEAGVVKYRVNMTGEQSAEDRVVKFRIIPTESTARINVDYKLPKGDSFVIPANSSFGWVEVEIMQDGSGSPTLVLELLETNGIKVMERYKRLGLQILYPSTPPDPATVEVIGDLTYFKDITIGAGSNPSFGNYVDAHTGYAYIVVGANAKPENIDFIVLRSAAGTEQNIITPSSSAVTAWTSSAHIATQWAIRNDGVLMRLPNPSIAELALFDNARSKADLLNAYQAISASITSRPGYNATNDGPGPRVRSVGNGDLVVFKSNTKGVVAIMKVTDMATGNAGHLKGQLKSAQ